MQDKTRQSAWGKPQSFGLGQFGKAAQMLHTATVPAAAGEEEPWRGVTGQRKVVNREGYVY